MTSLSQKETRQLLQRGIVMCRELIDKPDILIDIGITKARIEEVFNEADSICNA